MTVVPESLQPARAAQAAAAELDGMVRLHAVNRRANRIRFAIADELSRRAEGSEGGALAGPQRQATRIAGPETARRWRWIARHIKGGDRDLLVPWEFYEALAASVPHSLTEPFQGRAGPEHWAQLWDGLVRHVETAYRNADPRKLGVGFDLLAIVVRHYYGWARETGGLGASEGY